MTQHNSELVSNELIGLRYRSCPPAAAFAMEGTVKRLSDLALWTLTTTGTKRAFADEFSTGLPAFDSNNSEAEFISSLAG